MKWKKYLVFPKILLNSETLHWQSKYEFKIPIQQFSRYDLLQYPYDFLVSKVIEQWLCFEHIVLGT